MSTQSDYINAVQTRTAVMRSTLFAIDPTEAYTTSQKIDAVEQAMRSAPQLGDEFDSILELWLGRVERVAGDIPADWWGEIRTAYRTVQTDVVLPALKARLEALKGDAPAVDPHVQNRLTPQSQGVETGRRAA
jgi:hypothetical protein